MAEIIMTDAHAPAPSVSLRPKYKLGELPLVKEQRSAIDALFTQYQKQGGYDSMRKQIWTSFNASEGKTALTDRVNEVADSEIDKNPGLLSRDRDTAAALINGALDRSGIYKDVEAHVDRELAKHLDMVLASVRELRRKEVGEEQAAAEEQRGSKTDEDYERETEGRIEERTRNRNRLEEVSHDLAQLRAKIRAMEEKKLREEQAKRDEEDRKRREKEDEERRERRRKERHQFHRNFGEKITHS